MKNHNHDLIDPIWTPSEQAMYEASRHRYDKPRPWQAVMSGKARFSTSKMDRPVPGDVSEIESEPTKPYEFRDGVHLPQKHRPTQWRMSHAFVGKSQPNGIPVNPTRIASGELGREKRTDAKRWKTPTQTRKTTRVRAKADKWLAKHGSKV